jgi:predicted NUDIX family NTP pyrophosphohydrolase
MAKTSAGLLVYRFSGRRLEVLLVHPGGPYWAGKDKGAWSIPKGEYDETESAQAAALREFYEELQLPPPTGELVDLGEVVQPGGKRVRAWCVEGEMDISRISSNTFEMEWPPRSGRRASFPEVDRAEWFGIEEAREKINPAQAAFLDQLVSLAPLSK